MKTRSYLLPALALALMSPVGHAADEDLDELRAAAASGSEWRLVRYDALRNIKAYVKNEDGRKIRSFRVETVLDASMDMMARVNFDIDNYKRWYFATLESKLLKRVSDTEYIYYLVHDAPIGTPDRDVVLKAVIEPYTARRGYALQRITALPDYLPVRPPYVRMLAENMTVKWTPIGNNQLRFEAEGYLDPGGLAPSWAINFVQGRGPYANMLGLQRMLRLPQYRESTDPLPFRYTE